MRSNNLKSALVKSGLAASVLLLASAVSHARSVSLTAGPAMVYLPDGSAVPMWGYSCGTVAPIGATCAKLNPAGQVGVGGPATLPDPLVATNGLWFNGT